MEFSRFEYAVKRAGTLVNGKQGAPSDAAAIAIAISADLSRLDSESYSEAKNYLLSKPRPHT